MEAAEAREYSAAESEEVRRLCVVFGVSQSNQLYRILNANDKTEVTAGLVREEHVKSEGRGGSKCGIGEIWDEVRGICV